MPIFSTLSFFQLQKLRIYSYVSGFAVEWEFYGDFGSLTGLAFGSDLGVVEGGAVFYDGQAQAGTSILSATSFAYPVKIEKTGDWNSYSH